MTETSKLKVRAVLGETGVEIFVGEYPALILDKQTSLRLASEIVRAASKLPGKVKDAKS